MSTPRHEWWASLRHGGLLVDTQRLDSLLGPEPPKLSGWLHEKLRLELLAFERDAKDKRSNFVRFVLQRLCGFTMELGEWAGGSNVDTSWTRHGPAGEAIRPQQLWLGSPGATLPIFVVEDARLGIGKGRVSYARVLQWLRRGPEQLAILTNGRQWRLVFAGMDYDAFCEWDTGSWLAEGGVTAEFQGFMALVSPALWVPENAEAPCRLLAAVNDSRKGQAELSQVLGERVRKAVELLIQAHAPALNDIVNEVKPADIYHAAVRVVMRLVVILFAESREGLLPRSLELYHRSYSLAGLREDLVRASQYRLRKSHSGWPRVLALMQLMYKGCAHEALPVSHYGGELFAPGDAGSPDSIRRVLHVFENACLNPDRPVVNDFKVKEVIELLSRTEVRIRSGRSSTMFRVPVDFSSLDSEYIGILYEGLLDYELRCAGKDKAIVFLAVGNQPALPLETLEQMDDKTLKTLLEKMKKDAKASSPSAEESEEGSGEEEESSEEAEEEDDATEEDGNDEEVEAETTDVLGVDEEEAETEDIGQTLRERALAWARRASLVAGLIRKLPVKANALQQDAHAKELEGKAKQLIAAVVLPGEWYVVRWGGTRKGSGTYYTRPQLATPTVHRTLQPLAYDPPLGEDGQPDLKAPSVQWTPKPPEQILAIKLCDPACGSGSFLLGSLRYLTSALFDSLQLHKRLEDYEGRSLPQMLWGDDAPAGIDADRLPDRPEDDNFEPRLRALLRRYVVERCIYGVDLDPLAVELCRLSLWIETLDRQLPMTFLNHKVKCGNSLVGAWFDTFAHYPLMAWEREGGDSTHSNGVHFKQKQFTKAISAKAAEAKAGMIRLLDGRNLLSGIDIAQAQQSHSAALRELAAIHALGATQIEARRQRYEALQSEPGFVALREAFDLWCALWFWPLDKLDLAPLPEAFASGKLGAEVWDAVRETTAQRRFFHWELEFPDVFNAQSSGFDAMLGNPPWDTLQPMSKEFFSAIDPLFRGYGKQEALEKQREYFSQDETTEVDWLSYNAGFKSIGNWLKNVATPFGDRIARDASGKQTHDINLGNRGASSFESSKTRHGVWKQQRDISKTFADPGHPFLYQGEGKAYTYKMFLELGHALLRTAGRMGFIVPSGIYSDFPSIGLRRLFVEHCRWEWLFSFENRQKIFDIHSSYKFNPIVVSKGGTTQSINAAFMRRDLSDWEHAELHSTQYPRDLILELSPVSMIVVEIQTEEDVYILRQVALNSCPLRYSLSGEPMCIAETPQGDVNLSDKKELETIWHSTRVPPGYQVDDFGRLVDETGVLAALPIYQGAMIHQHNPFHAAYSTGFGHHTKWQEAEWTAGGAQFFWPIKLRDPIPTGTLRLLSRRITNSTNTRTMIAALLPEWPSSDSTLIWMNADRALVTKCFLVGVINSLVFDWIARGRISGSTGATSLDMSRIQELALPSEVSKTLVHAVARLAAMLNLVHNAFAAFRLRLACQGVLMQNDTRSPYLHAERTRLNASIDALAYLTYGLTSQQSKRLVNGCDYPKAAVMSKSFTRELDAKGFWRVDKDKHPEHRLTVLSLVAFHDLLQHVEACGGDREAGIAAFMAQNDGEGWLLPGTLRLADYGLGHDERALEHQPVRECFGPRFYDWQLAQSAEESWRECHLHARNLLGAEGYQALLDELDGKAPAPAAGPGQPQKYPATRKGQHVLFTPEQTGGTPLFESQDDTEDQS